MELELMKYLVLHLYIMAQNAKSLELLLSLYNIVIIEKVLILKKRILKIHKSVNPQEGIKFF